ncbi:PP2C family protein-serine/threonine phosphatase [[Clostridium] aminophilum]|uniref:Sigma-B regulation protein RsbU (Phosphoserine phosphatase) n=1 Tax=[Clostridium] aminophilum TaxID=1526 RepID=A0A1I6ITR6_9FIRM|nr:PP2C family protein-serine/threonine phosphatase [[Clostridium] aminophilum]SFR70135.1 sigma-B regulation protein RsbU (phosphoserine phosphatase) [[Clostridium] aminophilum]
MENKKKSINRALYTGTTVLVLVISLLMGAFGFWSYVDTVFQKDQAYLRDILKLTQKYIDGDDLEKCIETKQKSEKYEYAQSFLDQVKENYDDIEYIYIIKPLNANDSDNIMDVMAGITAEEKETDYDFYSVELGKLNKDGYSATVAGQYLNGMDAKDITYFANHTEFGYDYTGMLPIRNSQGKAVALLAIDISMNEITKVLMTYAVATLVMMILIAMLAVYFVNRWLKNRVIDPVLRLEKVSEAFVESSRRAEMPEELVINDPDIHTGDEIESLSVAISDMFVGMKNYMSSLLTVTREKERIGAELDVANNIQASMLPRIFPAFPDHNEFDIYATMDPAKEVGGDFYDYFMLDDHTIGLVMADVSGKGVPAALFMVISKTLIKNRCQDSRSPAEVLSYVNDQLSEGNDSDMFVTVWLAILDINTGKGLAANAGHEHPAIRRKGGKYELDIYRHSPAVATMEGMRFREHPFELNPGDSLFVYTDGVPEANDEAGKFYGTDRMIECLNADPDADVQKLLIEVREDIRKFAGEAEQFDDITMLVFDFWGPDGKQK